MDSLTQLTVGAACGHAVLGHKVGRRALGWGAILGTLPDLDVLIPLGGPVNDFVYHRGFSHSIFLLAALAPLFAWLICKIHPDTRRYYVRWTVLCFVVFQVAVLLDLLTIYGTQIFWPFDTTPQAVPVLFIIDPFFTLPVLLGVIAVLVLKNHQALADRVNKTAIAISASYVIWALMAGHYVEQQVREKLANQDIDSSQFVASPGPFNTLLWRVIGISNDRYFETYYSLLDDDSPLFVDFYPRNLELLKGIEQHPPVEKLQHFTRGYYALSLEEGFVTMTDLRMGSEPDYVFRFKVARVSNPHPVPIDDVQLRTRQDLGRLGWVWDRIWQPLPQHVADTSE